MKKSVYSLVLMDEVIEAIDSMAYSLSTSRSNLINQILAKQVALITPQMHMQTIFDEMARLLSSHQNFQIQNQASNSLFSVRSVLRYKYNPTIRYAISLTRESNGTLGELKVISRTQSEVLARYLYTFFNLWSRLELQYGLPGWTMEEGAKWNRKLAFRHTKDEISCEDIAEAIATYMQVVDEGLKIHFTYAEDVADGERRLQHHFKTNYEAQKIIL